MRVRLSCFPLAILTALLMLLGLLPAAADDSLTTTNDTIIGRTEAKRSFRGDRDTSGRNNARLKAVSRTRYTYLPKSEYKSQMTAYRKELAAAIAANNLAAANQSNCIDTVGQFACGRFRQGELPTAPNIRQAADPAAAAPAAPALSPEQVAYIASARLRLTAPK